MACRFNLPNVQERLTGAVRQLNKAKTLVRIEPFHSGHCLTAGG